MRVAGVIAATALAVLGASHPLLAQSDARTPVAADPPVPAPGREAEARVGPIVVGGRVDNSKGDAAFPVITLDQDALYMQSAWGKRVQGDIERMGREIATENDRLETMFANEEQQLTELRASLPPDEFRKRAEEFDKRVVEVRRARENAARELQARVVEERAAFFRAALPVLASFMDERGALAVLDQRAIFVAAEDIDVTETLGKVLDAEIGAGPAKEMPDASQPPAVAVPEGTSATPAQQP